MPLNTTNYGSSKSNDHRFKNLTFLRTRDKTTSNKNDYPHPPMGGAGGEGGIQTFTYNRPFRGGRLILDRANSGQGWVIHGHLQF